MSELVAVNVRYMGERGVDLPLFPDILRLPKWTKWMDLEAMMKAQIDSDDVQIRYMDIDDDPITISSQDELNEAFRLSASSNNVLRIQVKHMTCKGPAQREVLNTDAIPMPSPPDKTDEPTQDTVLKETTIEAETNVPEETQKEVVSTVNPVDAAVLGDKKEGPSQEINAEETGENPPKDLLQDAETGTFSKQHFPRKRSKRSDVYTRVALERGEAKRHSKSADRAVLSRKIAPGETTEDNNSVPYPKFVEFLEQLKHDLRSEIVRDVTRKTVKQVLKGLDGAVIQSVQGTSGVSPPTSMPSASPPPSSPTTISTYPIYYHSGVICDNCQRNIVGSRYKCANCADFDLCEECESLYGVHALDHVFMKLRRPVKARRIVDGCQVPLLDSLVYKPEDMDATTDQLSLEKFQRKMARKQEKLKKKEEKLVEKQKKKEEKLKRRLETTRDLPYKREKLDLPVAERSIPTSILMRAEFLYDVTIPDYTPVQPGTKMQKTWRMKNVGSATWTDITQLRLMWGNIPVTKTEVPVPHLHPDEEGDITAELIAPDEPGKYHSHWKMFDAGMQFGHRVWCAIIVVPKELLEPVQEERLKVVLEEPEPKKQEDQEPCDEIPVAKIEESAPLPMPETLVTVESDSEKGDNSESDSAVNKVELDLTTAAAAVAQLKLEQKPVAEVPGGEPSSFEMLERIPPKVSQTATPSNTPLDVTPPKSPAPEPQDHMQSPLSNSSSVEIVSGEQDEDLAQMTEYVQERMAGLGLKPEIDVDLESLSSFSEDDDDDDSSISDNDFFIVPLPDCFDPTKPMIQSVIDVSDDEEVDSNHNTITSTDHSLSVEDTQSLPSSSCSVPAPPIYEPVVEAAGSLTAEPQISATEGATDPTYQVSFTEGFIGATNQPDSVKPGAETDEGQMGGAADIEQTGGASVSEPKTNVEQTSEPSGAAAEQQEEVTTTEDNGEASEGTSDKDPTPPNPSEFANQIMTTAVNAATRAATHAYATAKGVFYTLQAKHAHPQGEFRAPQSNWKPNENKWKPPQEKWTPPKTDRESDKTESTLPKKDSGPMGRLIEMGFCDRKLNNELLQKHENNLDMVIQELLQRNDNDWADRRH